MSDELIELPEGWGWVTLGELGEWSSGGTPSRTNTEYYGGEIPWVKTGNLCDGLIKDIDEKITQKGLINSSAKLFPKGSLIIAMYGATIGKLGILDQPAATNQACAVLLSKGITNKLIQYIFYYLLFIREDLRMIGQGGAQPNINQGIIKKLILPLPPLNEQKRIVTKIEELTDRTQKAKEALDSIPQLCDRFRQSVLAAAFRGDLTKEWREQNPDVEPASVLLERIRKERRQKWEEVELKRMLDSGKPPKDDKWKLRYKEPNQIDETQLVELPFTWKWVPVEFISTKVVDGVHKKPNYVETGIPFITVKNLTATCGISFEQLNYISLADHEEFFKRANPEKGDILISKDGTLGITRVVRTDKVFSIFVSVALVKPVRYDMSDYLELALTSPQMQQQMLGTGSGLQHIHLKDLRRYVVPICSLEEQTEIVTKIEKYFAVIDNIEKQHQQAAEKLETLNQSILAKAFRGELVPQDPNDEPASLLLERIRSEREKSNPSKPKSKRTSKPNKKTNTIES